LKKKMQKFWYKFVRRRTAYLSYNIDNAEFLKL